MNKWKIQYKEKGDTKVRTETVDLSLLKETKRKRKKKDGIRKIDVFNERNRYEFIKAIPLK